MADEAKSRLDRLERRRLYEEFSASGTLMRDAGAWCEQKSAALSIPPNRLMRYLAAERDLELCQLRDAQSTHAQRVANLAGASLARAIRALDQSLSAETIRRVFNREGELVDEFAEPDWAARNSAAEKLLKIHGGFAAEKLDVHQVEPGDPSILTDEQLQNRLKRLREDEQAR